MSVVKLMGETLASNLLTEALTSYSFGIMVSVIYFLLGIVYLDSSAFIKCTNPSSTMTEKIAV